MKSSAATKSKKRTKARDDASFYKAILKTAAFDGWTDEAISNAAQTCGLSGADVAKAFPAGVADVVEGLGAWIDDVMAARVAAERKFAKMRVRDKVGFCVRARLEHLLPYREAMKRLMVWYAMPRHAVMGVKRISKTCDLIWCTAGDTSTDYNFYTKRILLSGVLKLTILFWLSDASEGCAATWEFLDCRLGEVVKAGKTISLLREMDVSEALGHIRARFTR